MTTLKPCPFCGGMPKMFEHDHIEGYYVACAKGCGISARLETNPELASASWNHRPGEEAVAEECAKIVEEPSGEYSVGHRKLPYWDGEKKAAEIRARFGGKA